jgi:hypothetical protein
MTKDLKTKTNATLVNIYNGFCPDKPLSGWKGKKSDLIDRIEALTPKQTIQSLAIELLCQVTHYENKTEKSGNENLVTKDNPNARSVGLPYDQVLKQIHEVFEGCKTTVDCLRWYASKIRKGEPGYEDMRTPQRRPRVKRLLPV